MKESIAKKRILNVASRLFYEQGYNSTGINQIIDEADIAKGSLYNHFSSKRDLLSAYIQHAEKTWFEGLDDHLAAIKDPKRKILALFDYWADKQISSKFGGCQFNKVSAEVPKEDLEVFELTSHQKDLTKKHIKDLLNNVKLTQPQLFSTDMLAETIFLILEGATTASTIHKDADHLRNAKKIIEKIL